MSYTTQYEEYTENYNNIIKVLSDIIESGEVTSGSQALLEEAYIDYNNSYADTLRTFQTIKESTQTKKLQDIEIKKIDATKKNIVDILTNNGVNNSIYLDDNDNIMINGEYVPDLNQIKITVDQQNKKIESMISGGEIEIDGEKKSVQVAFTDLKQTVDTVSSTVTNFQQKVEKDYYTKEQTTSQITQKASDITTTVANTYATQDTVNNMGTMIQQKTDEITSTVASLKKNLADNYSTSTEVTSQITQKTDEITGSISKTYATKDSVTSLDTTLQTKIGEVSSTVTSVKKDLADNYTNNTDLATQLLQTENSITATVKSTYATKDSVNTFASQIQQTENKINMVVASNSTETNVILTDKALTAISNNINLSADNIKLEGYTTINGGFKVDTSGNIEATNANITGEINATSGKISSDLEVEGLSVSGTLTADSLNVRQLNCGDLNGVVSDVALVVDSTIDTSNIFENNGKFSSLQRAIESIPKNLNGYTVSIEVNSILYENITIKGFNGGTLYIKFNKNNCGYIFGHNCGAELLLQGTGTTSQILVSNYKTTGNVNMRMGGDVSYNIVQTVPTGATLLLTNFNSNGWGYTTYNGKSGWMSTNTSYMVKEEVYKTSGTSTAIQPSELLTQDGKNYAAVFRNCPYVALFDLEVYGKTGNASNYAIGSIRGSYVDIENSKICGSENGMLASRGGRIFESNVNGKVNKIAQKAELSGMIYINDGTTINGTISKDSSSQVIYSESGAIKDTTSNVGTNNNTTTATSTVTITSTGADTYRSTMYNNYKQDNTARQGNYGWGDCNGLWLFGSKFTQLKGKTITKLTVTVNRIQGGIYGNVTATLKMHGYSTKPSGMPTYTSGWSTSITTPINTTKTIEITDATVLNAISNGTCKGFGVQGAYDSSHYAVFDGNCTLTATIQ